VWRWSITPSGGARHEGNSLAATPFDAEALKRERPDYVPAADQAFAVHRAIVESVDGRRTLHEIAERVRAQFPQLFRDADDARRRVLKVLAHK
jgi:hypothetical protein